MLRQGARGVDEQPRQFERQRQAAITEIQVELFGVFLFDAFPAPAPHRRRQPCGHVLGQPERLADLAHRAARAVARDDRGQGAARPAIGIIDPLDHFLAALVLEIDVDVGRLAALGRDEALEQQLGAHRIDRGDAKNVADRRVRRRAAPLAQDVLAPRERDDRMNGQKIGRIIELGDQAEFMRQLRTDLSVQALGIPLGRPCPGQPLQLLLRRPTRHTDFVGILVFEFVEAEGAARGQLGAARDRPRVLQVAAEQSFHFLPRLEMAVGDALASIAELVDRAFLADAGDDILQQPAIGRMVKNVAGRDRRHARRRRDGRQVSQPHRVARLAADRQGEIGPVGENAPGSRQRRLGRRIGAIGREHRDQPVAPVLDVGPVEVARALAGAALADAEQPAHPTIGQAVGRIDQQRRAVGQVEAAPDDRAYAGGLRCIPRADDARDRVAIDDPDRRQVEQGRRGEQFVGGRCAAQEAEVGRDLQLDITGLAI